MTETERVQWITILDAAAQRPGNELNDEWEWLMDELGLPYEYFLAVREAIAQGRWREAKNPRAYVKTVAKREANKMCLLAEPANSLGEETVTVRAEADADSDYCPVEAALDHYAYLSESDGENDPRFLDNDGHERSFRDFVLSMGPKEFKRVEQPSRDIVNSVDELNAMVGDDHHYHADPVTRVDWESWAVQADFDEWDLAVFKYKLASTSRDKALSEQPDDVSRKALQAAWRKFDRGGVERLRAVIQGPKMSRKCRLSTQDI
jgi:hypothetical protein